MSTKKITSSKKKPAKPGVKSVATKPAKKGVVPVSTHDEDKKKHDFDLVLELISSGLSVRTACETCRVPKTTFLKYVDSDQYARARDACADTLFDRMLDLEIKCLQGEIEPKAFKEAMDVRKWVLSRMKPKTYGDKVSMEHSSPNSDKVEHNHAVITPAIQELLDKLGGNNG